MKPETWRRVDDCLADALELPTAEREEYLTIRLGDDLEALAEALKLVGQAASAEQLFAKGPVAGLGGLAAGARLGPWELVKPLGSGGMGVVWLGRRVDGQATMMAAIKLLPPALSGPLRGDGDMLRRFLLEKQILARLQHPNIARLLDASAGAGDTPNFVMEYVEGAPLLTYLKEITVDPMRLFLKICSAVQYAHANLIIHRDLKPQNILVGADGEPKLLDFGIARILNDPAGDASITLRRAFSLDYASPEQIRGGAISTATDVYSLGLILFEMITGERARRWNDKALGEVLKESEHFVLPDARGMSADARAVLGKATSVEESQRYASVSEFAADVERLMLGKPVQARPAGALYQVSCFARRNAWAVGASVLAVALIGGLGIWGLLSARDAERRAGELQVALGAEQVARQQGEAQRREAVAQRELARQMGVLAKSREAEAEARLQDMLRVFGGLTLAARWDISKLPGGTGMSIKVTEKALGQVEAIVPTPAARRNFLWLRAEAHGQLAELYGGSNSNVGDEANSLKNRRKSVALWTELNSLDAGKVDWERGMLEAKFRLALPELPRSMKDIEPVWKEWEAKFLRLQRRAPKVAIVARTVGSFYFYRSVRTLEASASKRTDMEAAMRFFSQGLEEPSPNRTVYRDLALTHKYLAGLVESKPEEQLKHASEALRLDRIRSAQDPNDATARIDTGFSMVAVADAQRRAGDLGAAQRGYRDSYELRKALLAMDPQNVFVQRSLAYPMREYGVVSARLEDWAGLNVAVREFILVLETADRKTQALDAATVAYWKALIAEADKDRSLACQYFGEAARVLEGQKEGVWRYSRATLVTRVESCTAGGGRP